MLPYNLDEQIKSKQQDMLRDAEQHRLANRVQPARESDKVSSGWSFRQALQQAIAMLAFQQPQTQKQEREQLRTGEIPAFMERSKLATDSGIHRIR